MMPLALLFVTSLTRLFFQFGDYDARRRAVLLGVERIDEHLFVSELDERCRFAFRT